MLKKEPYLRLGLFSLKNYEMKIPNIGRRYVGHS